MRVIKTHTHFAKREFSMTGTERTRELMEKGGETLKPFTHHWLFQKSSCRFVKAYKPGEGNQPSFDWSITFQRQPHD
jgi:hypothetical protein